MFMCQLLPVKLNTYLLENWTIFFRTERCYEDDRNSIVHR